jgi:hypothetical protein
MAYTVESNRKMLEDWTRRVGGYNIVQAMRSLVKMSQVLTGTITVNSEPHDASAYFSDQAKKIQGLLEEQANAPGPFLTSIQNLAGKWQSRLAVIAMQIGLIFLGIGAIRLFLLP